MTVARYFGSWCESTKLDGGWELCRDADGVFARRTIKEPGLYKFPRWLDAPAHAITVVCPDVGQDLTVREYRRNGLVIGHRRAQIEDKPFISRRRHVVRDDNGEILLVVPTCTFGPIPAEVIAAVLPEAVAA